VGPLYLFDVMSRNNHWLGARQALVAQNVANASTPGYKAVDVKPFSEALDRTQLDLARTAEGHLNLGDPATVEPDNDTAASNEVLHSGNNVGLEKEFIKSSEIGRAYSLNTSVMKSFNRMLLLSVKG